MKSIPFVIRTRMIDQNKIEQRRLRSYVLRAARMSKLQRRAYDKLLPRYSIPYAVGEVDFSTVFPEAEGFVVEIGFGMGEATVRLAEENPTTGFVGIEVHRPGVGKVVSEIEARGLGNLRVVNHDAVEVFENMIPDASLDGIHIFFPDPWPKKKHHKRRLIQHPFVRLVQPKLKTDGYLYVCTDWEEYDQQVLQVLAESEGLYNPYDGFAVPQPWRPTTKFEQKGREKSHVIREILFRRSS